MFRSFYWIIFLLYIFSFCPISAQKKNEGKPKIGLVLSGGSAKGFIHIGVLKELEKNGIVPDYITGTSMGAIIGALYAIGYSAEEIEKIALSINWDRFLSNKIELNKIAFEEKPYYGRYMLEMPIIGFKPEITAGLNEGQEISLTFSKLTKPVHNITDFDDFPIPFRCVATDINTGELVLLSKGNLAEALRASMAIPTLFTPVEKNGKLLVDGGLIRNFPVEEVKNMGAEIIIGSYAGFTPYAYRSKKNLVGLISQAAYILSYRDTEKQKNICDILIEPDLKDYSASQYSHIREFIDIGEKSALGKMDLIKSTIGNTPRAHRTLITQRQDKYIFDSIIVDGNNTIPEKFIKGKLRLTEKDTVSISELEKKISILYGTQYFDKITYKINTSGELNILILQVKETEPKKMKVALHYDSENKVGLTVNLSMLNLGLPGSKTTLETIIAENPHFDINYFKYLGYKQRMAFVVGTHSYKNDITVYNNSKIKEAILNNLYYSIYFTMQRTLSATYSYGFMVEKDFSFQKPTIANYPYRLIDNMNTSNTQAKLFYGFNTMKSVVYPKKGDRFNALVSYNFQNKYSIESIFPNDDLQFKQFETVNKFMTIEVDYQKNIPLGSIFSLITGSEIGISSAKRIDINDQTFIGGFNSIYKNTVSFWGASPYQYNTTDYFYSKLELQAEIKKDIYINTLINYIDTNIPVQLFFPDRKATQLRNKNYRLGYGLSIGYNSVLGPLKLSVSKDNNLKEILFNISLGYVY